MRIYEVFLVLRNGVMGRGCVPATSARNAREFVLSQLTVNASQVASIEVHRV